MTSRRNILLILSASSCALAGLSLIVLSRANAVSTRTMTLDDADSLSAGTLERAAVSSDGSVVKGVDVHRIDLPDVALAYSYARGADGAIYVGTGNEGRVYRIRADSASVFAET